MVFKSKTKATSATSDDSGSRQQLLRAAAPLFSQQGLEGTSVRDIARAAGTNICMISYHFGGKEGLYRACLKDYGESRVAQTQGMLEAPASVEEFKVRLKLFVQSVVRWNAERPEFSRIIGKEIEAGLPVAADIFESTFLNVMQQCLKFFKEAQKNGIIRKDLDSLYIMHILYGTIVHLARFDIVSKKYFNTSIKDPKNRDALVQTLLDTLLDGILKEDAV